MKITLFIFIVILATFSKTSAQYQSFTNLSNFLLSANNNELQRYLSSPIADGKSDNIGNQLNVRREALLQSTRSNNYLGLQNLQQVSPQSQSSPINVPQIQVLTPQKSQVLTPQTQLSSQQSSQNPDPISPQISAQTPSQQSETPVVSYTPQYAIYAPLNYSDLDYLSFFSQNRPQREQGIRVESPISTGKPLSFLLNINDVPPQITQSQVVPQTQELSQSSAQTQPQAALPASQPLSASQPVSTSPLYYSSTPVSYSQPQTQSQVQPQRPTQLYSLYRSNISPVEYTNTEPAGNYKFGYTGESGSFREETRSVNGAIQGSYGYGVPNGKRMVVTYSNSGAKDEPVVSPLQQFYTLQRQQ